MVRDAGNVPGEPEATDTTADLKGPAMIGLASTACNVSTRILGLGVVPVLRVMKGMEFVAPGGRGASSSRASSVSRAVILYGRPF